MIFEKVESKQFRGAGFVGLGCGDFYIGSQLIVRKAQNEFCSSSYMTHGSMGNLRLCVVASRLITIKHQKHSRLINGPDYMSELYER